MRMTNVEKWPLPEGWEWKQIAEVCEVNPRRPSIERNATTPTSFLPMAGVDEAKGIIRDLETRPYQKVARGYTYFEEADVLFAKITPSMQNGKSAIAQGLIDGICFGSTEFHVLRPSDEVTPEWVHLFVRQLNFRQEATQYFRGSVGQQRVPKEFLAEHLIPIPPLDVQRRIVARVEALFAELAAARHTHAAFVHDTERLMDAVLAEVFYDPLADLPQGWKVVNVSDICAKPQYGYTKSATEEPIGPKFLRITDIQNGQVNWDTVPYCECEEGNIKKYLLNSGDLVFARSGATTGKTFLVQNPPQSVFASYLIRLQIVNFVPPEYVYWFFQSPYYWGQIQPRGAAQPNVNARVLGNLKVPIPTKDEVQRRIVAYLDEVQAHTTELQRTAAALAADLDRTEQAILAQAFKGELRSCIG